MNVAERRKAEKMKRKTAQQASEPATAELDREAIEALRDLARERLAQRRTNEPGHDPCRWCGLSSSPSWRGPSRTSDGLVCGRCAGWFTQPDDLRLARDPLDVAAAVLAGIASPSRIPSCKGLAAAVGLVPFIDSGRQEANPTPWDHCDIAALRDRVAELARTTKIVTLPPRWNPHRRVEW